MLKVENKWIPVVGFYFHAIYEIKERLLEVHSAESEKSNIVNVIINLIKFKIEQNYLFFWQY